MQNNLDLDKISLKMKYIRECLSKLEHLKKLSYQDFIADFRNITSCKYLLQTSIEAIIDICNHIVSRKKLGKPSSYSDTIKILLENSYISTNLAEKLIRMVKFRNRIVHLYLEVDNQTLYEILQNNLSDFELFWNEISSKIFNEE
ncbi:protein of unknown function DUF86 [Caldicellulosiruptor kronotskyensis 2002]|uniref:DUF86 domain-containing protein n=1 Tax=Caldicellulosiruptor kronotskyensis (strain DSM 18902 / VKM B-2412 / 2002) TaxID=632348 RepID=E4SDW9_CALK2|nr:DUF86 domain-containing protein [Caldicellulosiruptor kronotskyensis]ADQ45256.1 protein of unknown function DUF86 [Caldicellulosiruptor kronotskyensis 2002]